jgi:hypothetical protein
VRADYVDAGSQHRRGRDSVRVFPAAHKLHRSSLPSAFCGVRNGKSSFAFLSVPQLIVFFFFYIQFVVRRRSGTPRLRGKQWRKKQDEDGNWCDPQKSSLAGLSWYRLPRLVCDVVLHSSEMKSGRASRKKRKSRCTSILNRESNNKDNTHGGNNKHDLNAGGQHLLQC